jgi:tryptophanase
MDKVIKNWMMKKIGLDNWEYARIATASLRHQGHTNAAGFICISNP